MTDDELQLEREKFEFEKQKFCAEADRRAEEVETIRAERRKTELEADDLSIPYKERSAHKTAIFQGIALVLGVLSAIISVGLWGPVFEAYKAGRERDAAVKEAAQARADKASAINDRNVANQQNETAQGELIAEQAQLGDLESKIDADNRLLDTLNEEKTKAEEDAILAPLKESLASLDLDDFYSDPHRDRLIAEFRASDPARQKVWSNYVEGFALDQTHSAVTRLEAVDSLYEVAKAQSPPNLIGMANYRRQLIDLGSAGESVFLYEILWSRLIKYLGVDSAGPYICDEYRNAKRSNDNKIVGLKPRMIEFIANKIPRERECLDVYWDYLDPQEPKVISTCTAQTIEMILLTCVKRKATWSVDLEIHKLDYVNPEGSHPTGGSFLMPAAFGSGPLEGLREAAHGGPFGGGDAGTAAVDATAEADKWQNQNSDLVGIFNERGLKRLRTCRMEIWDLYVDRKDIGMADLAQYCPIDTWPQTK